MSRTRLLTGITPVLVLVLVAAVAGAIHSGFPDLSVYRYGGRGVLDGLPLYEADDPVTGYPFTYPPFAAVAMAPLALLPEWLAAALWTGASVSALAAVVVVVRRELGRPAPGWLVALLTAAALAMEPVWQNLAFGQVNALLMLMVLLDLLGPERRWSGVLVGIAAGVKLTPLLFVVLLVMVGRRTAAGRAAIAFAGTVAVGFVAMPDAAATYWSHGLFDASRVGPPALAHNQSTYGALSRLLDGQPTTLLWLAVAMPLALAVLLLAAHRWRADDRVLATCLAALAMLIVSPISWSHHWVWVVPVALALWERSRVACVAWVGVFMARPIVWPGYGRNREYSWGLIDHLVGNAYLIAAFALCIWAVRRPRGGSPRVTRVTATSSTLPTLPTSLVGSYAQPNWLIDRAKLAGRFPPRVRARELWRVEPEYLAQAQDDATVLAIRAQEEAGLDIVTDGEMRRESYSNHFATALDGIDIDNPGTGLDRSGHPNPVPRIVGPIVRPRPVGVRDVEFLKANTDHTVKMTVPGPFTMSQQAQNDHYPDLASAALAYAAAVNAEIKDLHAAGADLVQIDEPYMQARPDAAREYGLTALNAALDGVTGTTAVHICFGYAAIIHGRPEGYSFLPELAGCSADQISIETAQSGLDLGVLKDLSEKTIILGVIDLSDHEVESAELVADRVRRAFPYTSPDRITIATDCGMKYLPRASAEGKLRAMAGAASILRAEL